MDKLDIIKTAAKFVVGSSVSFTAVNVIKNNATPKNALQTGEVLVGCAVLGYMAADAAESWTDAKIDGAADWFDKTIKRTK